MYDEYQQVCERLKYTGWPVRTRQQQAAWYRFCLEDIDSPDGVHLCWGEGIRVTVVDGKAHIACSGPSGQLTVIVDAESVDPCLLTLR